MGTMSKELLPTEEAFHWVSLVLGVLTMVITGLIIYSYCAFQS